MFYNVDKTTILNYANKIGYKVEKHPKLSDENKQFVVDNYNKLTAKELAAKFNINDGYIYYIWWRNGLCGKEKRIYNIDQNCFSNITTEEQAYALGFIAADGCISNNENQQNTLKISIHKNDIGILELMNSRVFKSNKPIYTRGKYCYVEYSSDKIYNDLNTLGLHPRKTYGNTYVELDHDLMRHFLRGYFDGDGSISWKKSHLCDLGISISGFQKNMDKIISHLESVNIYATFIQDKRYNCDNGDKFGSLVLTNKISKYAFLRYLYNGATIYLDRKYNIANEFVNKINNVQDIFNKTIISYYEHTVLHRLNFNMKKQGETIMTRGFEQVINSKKKTNDVAKLPTRGSVSAMAYDFYSNEDYKVAPNEIVKIWTDIKAYMQPDEALIINVRSSMGGKFMLANTLGWIDSDYYSNENNDGNIGIFLKNISDDVQIINKGDRIAQGMFINYLVADNGNTDILRTGGFGSTGKQ